MQHFAAPAPAPPGTQRPGGRTAQNRLAVFNATFALLAERDYADLSVEAIALRAGVHKTTVYRRWRSLDRLVADAFMDTGETLIDVKDSGDIESDARALARDVVHALRRPAIAAAVRAVLGSAPADARQHISHQYWASRLEHVGPMVARAVERGQLPAGTDPVLLIEAIAAPLYFRLLVSMESITRTDAHRAADAAIVAARAGIFVRRSATAQRRGRPSPRK